MMKFRARLEPGEPVLSAYFERFWLPILGPSGVVLMRRLAVDLRHAGGVDLSYEPDVLARCCGFGEAHLRRTLRRLMAMHLVRRNKGVYEVRVAVWRLDGRQVGRLPRGLAAEHRALTGAVALSRS